MKYKIWKFTLLAMFLSGVFASDWTADSLSNYMKARGKDVRVVDPDGFLKEATKLQIQKQIESISRNKNFKTYFIVLDSLSDKYKNANFQTTDIETFTREFVDLFMTIDLPYHALLNKDNSIRFPDEDLKNNSLVIIYSLNDRAYKMRTGMYVRRVLPDRQLNYLAESLKPLLKEKKFDEAFVKLFADLFNPVPDDNLLLYIILGVVCVVLLGMSVCCAFVGSKKVQRERSMTRNFNTLEQFRQNNGNVNIFIQENCAICLEKLNETTNIPPANNVALREAFLNCGHNYHTGCLRDWLETNNNCPLCRQLVEADEENGDQQVSVNRGDNNQAYDNRIFDALFGLQRLRYFDVFPTTSRRDTEDCVTMVRCCCEVFGCLLKAGASSAGGTSGSW